jgi:hypothetical protein
VDKYKKKKKGRGEGGGGGGGRRSDMAWTLPSLTQ